MLQKHQMHQAISICLNLTTSGTESGEICVWRANEIYLNQLKAGKRCLITASLISMLLKEFQNLKLRIISIAPTPFSYVLSIFCSSDTIFLDFTFLSYFCFKLQHPYVYGVLIFEAMATYVGQVSVLSLIALFGAATTAMVIHFSPLMLHSSNPYQSKITYKYRNQICSVALNAM